MSAGISSGPMLNAYPDSLGGTLGDIADFLGRPELAGIFDSLYVLPSLYRTDLDRGFSVSDYGLNGETARTGDLVRLRKLGIKLKLDFILNHASVLSPQFQDLLINGEKSEYRDFFIDWNRFWAGHGVMTGHGYIQPDPESIRDMFFRKPGLPLLMVRFPDGKEVPYWNTFYQEVSYEVPSIADLWRIIGAGLEDAERLRTTIRSGLAAMKKPPQMDFGRFEPHKAQIVALIESGRRYLGQMDLNVKSPLVWKFYEETLKTLAGYGAEIVRLDAFAYAPKEPGKRNFLNDPETWEVLERVRAIADRLGLTLLPEIHSRYDEGIHERIAEKGYPVYDFFLPGLILDAFERESFETLRAWIEDIRGKGLQPVNMLGCHDGIPLLDLKGLLDDDRIQCLIDTVVRRGGYVKDLHGQNNVYYQVNATYYSALGESDERLLLARALQIFMPGKPQVWYLDLFAGKNDRSAVERSGSGGHKEINRTNLSLADIEEGLTRHVVLKQLGLLRLRNSCSAFGTGSVFTLIPSDPHILKIRWERGAAFAELEADIKAVRYRIVTNAGPHGGSTADGGSGLVLESEEET